jgi:hypothetical protein
MHPRHSPALRPPTDAFSAAQWGPNVRWPRAGSGPSGRGTKQEGPGRPAAGSPGARRAASGLGSASWRGAAGTTPVEKEDSRRGWVGRERAGAGGCGRRAPWPSPRVANSGAQGRSGKSRPNVWNVRMADGDGSGATEPAAVAARRGCRDTRRSPRAANGGGHRRAENRDSISWNVRMVGATGSGATALAAVPARRGHRARPRGRHAPRGERRCVGAIPRPHRRGRTARIGNSRQDPVQQSATVPCHLAAGLGGYRRAEFEDGSRRLHLLGRMAGSRRGHDGESGAGGGGGRLGSGNPDRTPCNSLPPCLAIWLLARGVIGAPSSRMARDGGSCLVGWPGRGPAMTARVGLARGRTARIGNSRQDPMQQSAHRALPSGSPPEVIGAPRTRMARDGGTCFGRMAGSRPGHDGESGTGGGGGRLRSGIPDRTPCNSLPTAPCRLAAGPGLSARRRRRWLATAAPTWADGQVEARP